MSFTDAAVVRERAQQLAAKADEYHTLAIQLLNLNDQIKDIVNSLGIAAPPVVNLVALAEDNLGAANHQIGQVADVIENWAMKL